eukprot:5319575-Prymnesium_polylepis.1
MGSVNSRWGVPFHRNSGRAARGHGACGPYCHHLGSSGFQLLPRCLLCITESLHICKASIPSVQQPRRPIRWRWCSPPRGC